MKKLSILFLTLGMLIIFNGCQNNQTSKPASMKAEDIQTQESSKTKQSPTANYSDINVFWKDFRNSLINKDITVTKKFTQFPLETRGPLDMDPQIKFEEDKFEKVLTNYLQQSSGLELNETNLDYIKKHENLTSTELQNLKDNWARIGNMQFKLINNSWKLTFVYFEEDSYKNLGIDIRKTNASVEKSTK